MFRIPKFALRGQIAIYIPPLANSRLDPVDSLIYEIHPNNSPRFGNKSTTIFIKKWYKSEIMGELWFDYH